MISFLFGSVIGLTAMQAGIDMPRKNFVTCLHQASETALSQHMATADFSAFLAKTCEGQANNLMSGLVGFDVKNGVRRTQASADAKAQIDDYVSTSAENYAARAGPAKVTVAASPAVAPAAKAVTPAATPVAAPKP